MKNGCQSNEPEAKIIFHNRRLNRSTIPMRCILTDGVFKRSGNEFELLVVKRDISPKLKIISINRSFGVRTFKTMYSNWASQSRLFWFNQFEWQCHRNTRHNANAQRSQCWTHNVLHNNNKKNYVIELNSK